MLTGPIVSALYLQAKVSMTTNIGRHKHLSESAVQRESDSDPRVAGVLSLNVR